MNKSLPRGSLQGSFHCVVWGGFKGLSDSSTRSLRKEMPQPWPDESARLLLGQTHTEKPPPNTVLHRAPQMWAVTLILQIGKADRQSWTDSSKFLLQTSSRAGSTASVNEQDSLSGSRKMLHAVFYKVSPLFQDALQGLMSHCTKGWGYKENRDQPAHRRMQAGILKSLFNAQCYPRQVSRLTRYFLQEKVLQAA